MITLDTSAVYALCNRRDPDHRRTRRSFEKDPGPYLVPAGILSEVGYLLESRLGLKVLLVFLEDLSENVYTLDCGDQDFDHIRELLQRYANLQLGFADASVIACAERNGGRVLTLDERDFQNFSLV